MVLDRINRMDRIYGAVCRPTVGAAVPCRPHGVNRVENVEYVERGNWPWRTWREGERMGELAVENVERGREHGEPNGN